MNKYYILIIMISVLFSQETPNDWLSYTIIDSNKKSIEKISLRPINNTKNPKEAWETIWAKSIFLFLKDFNASIIEDIIKKRADMIIKFDKML